MTLPGDNQALLALLGDDRGVNSGMNRGVLPGLRPIGPAGRMNPSGGMDSSGGMDPSGRTDPANLAFQTQMRMAQALFTEPDPSAPGANGFALDASIVGDSLLMDALSTITRLMDRNSLDFSQVTAPVAKPASDQTGRAALLGGLSAAFESGSDGVAAIGYDKVGGTSYGQYQIASRPGGMSRFLAYLQDVKPEWAERLSQAGPANTGSVRGAMPEAWKAIAGEDPEGFARVQHDFIHKQYYQPARDMVLERTGLDMDQAPKALREVLWSTAVQHGPTGAADIFSQARQGVSTARAENSGLFRDLIAGVYENRQGRFGSSSQRVQQSVKNRLSREMDLALNMLAGGPVDTLV